MTVRAALAQGQKLLAEAGVALPRLTAEVLMMHAVSHGENAFADRAWLYAHGDDELRELWWIHYGRYLHERLAGKPTQYITGRQEFYGREFHVTPDVLVPRPETEHLIEAALAITNAAGGQVNPRVLDVGTGSGAIAVTLALETNADLFATDISPFALRVAQKNARRLSATVNFLVCDLAAALPDGFFDLIASNPPYVPERDSDTLQREVREFEPRVALFAGDDGLSVYRRLIPEAARVLRPGGWLVMELGDSAAESVRDLLVEWGELSFTRDLAGILRVVVAQKR